MQFSASTLIAAATLIGSAAADGFTLTVNTLGVSTVLIGPTTVVTAIGGMAVTTVLTDAAQAEEAIQLAIQLGAAAGDITTSSAAATTSAEETSSAAPTSSVEETSSSTAAAVEVATNAANKMGMASAAFGGLSLLYFLA